MAHNGEQTELMHQLIKTSEQEKSTEDVNSQMRRSFSWNRAFFTNDGVLDAEELSSMIEGGGSDVKHQLQRIDEIENLEAKLFEEIESSTKKTSGKSNLNHSRIKVSSGERDSQAKASRFSPKGTRSSTRQASKVNGPISPRRAVPTTSLSSLGSSTPIKTQPTRTSPLSGSSGSSSGKSVRSAETLARRNPDSKTGKMKADSPSKTPPGISTKNKVQVFSNLSSRTSPASPISPGSSGSSSLTSTVNRRSSRSKSVPRRSTVSNENPSLTNTRKKDDQKSGKPTTYLIPNITSSINLKNKPPPINSHPSPSTLLTSSITSQRQSESSSAAAISTVNQKSIPRDGRGTNVHHRTLNCDASAKGNLKNHPIGQTPDRNPKQPEALRPETGSISRVPAPSPKSGFYKEEIKTERSSSAKTRKLPPPKTAANHTSLKPNSPKTTTSRPSNQEQSSGKAKSCTGASTSKGVKKLLLVSPEVLDIKGKLNALKMEISMQKNSSCKMTPAESGKGESSSYISSHHVAMKHTNNQAKST